MKIFFQTLTIILFIFIIPSIVCSEQIKGSIEISPFSGGYLFEDNQQFGGGPVYGIGLSYNLTNHWGFQFSGSFGDFDINCFDSDSIRCSINDLDSYMIHSDLKYFFEPNENFYSITPYIIAGGGMLKFDNDTLDKDNYPMANYGLGLKLFLTEKISIHCDARHVLTYNDSIIDDDNEEDYKINNNFYYTIGFNILIGGKSKQKTDLKEQTKNKQPGPPPEKIIRDIDGKAWDSDGDGIEEYLDKCSTTPAGVLVDQNGCPFDTDQDGVYDYLDKCNSTPLGTLINHEGCPRDKDKDGVYDHKDKCPDTQLNITVDTSGCPEDADGDGITDDIDKCPYTNKGVSVDKNGCPVIKRKKEKKTIKLNISFDSSKATIKPIYYNQLNKIADFLKSNPKTSAIIEAHTDNIGNAKYNLKLSQLRAESVVSYLIKNFNIDYSRLKAVGYGESRPIADNKTHEGRQMNRRAVAIISTSN